MAREIATVQVMVSSMLVNWDDDALKTAVRATATSVKNGKVGRSFDDSLSYATSISTLDD
jgi:hypothetical protein